MFPDIWTEWVKLVAFSAGIGVGVFAYYCTGFVYLRKHLIPASGLAFVFLGTILIGASIWQSVEIEALGTRVKISELMEENLKAGSMISKYKAQARKSKNIAARAYRQNKILEKQFGDFVKFVTEKDFKATPLGLDTRTSQELDDKVRGIFTQMRAQGRDLQQVFKIYEEKWQQ